MKKTLCSIFAALIVAFSFWNCDLLNDAYEEMNSVRDYYLYVALEGTDRVRSYAVQSDGGLLQVGIDDNAVTDSTPHRIVIHPSQNYLYVSNSGDGSISAFIINQDGTLKPNGLINVVKLSGSPEGMPEGLAIHPSGKYLYAGRSSNAPQVINIFSIKDDGTLGSPTESTVSGYWPTNITINSTGTVLYASDWFRYITKFTVGNDGATLTNPVYYDNSGSTNPRVMAINHSNTYLYVSNDTGLGNTITGWTIGTDGTLSNKKTFDMAGTPSSFVAIHPNGKYLYSASTNGNFYGFSINTPDCSLDTVNYYSLTSFHGLSISIHPSGKFMYLDDYGSNTLYVKKISSFLNPGILH